MTATIKLDQELEGGFCTFSLSAIIFFISSDDCYYCQLYMGPEALANVYYISRKYK